VNAAIARLAEAVGTSSFGQWASGSALAYPVANVIHLLGLVMLIGAIGIVDLRLAGALRAVPVAPLYRSLVPIAIVGLILMVPSGATMFASDAITFAASAVFRLKITLVAVAIANAIAFHFLWRHRIDQWDAAPPIAGRVMAAGSLMLWLTIGALGRMIAYS
jgi:hypothetical protein